MPLAPRLARNRSGLAAGGEEGLDVAHGHRRGQPHDGVRGQRRLQRRPYARLEGIGRGGQRLGGGGVDGAPGLQPPRPPRCGWRASSAAASAFRVAAGGAVQHRLGAPGGLVEAAVGVEQHLGHPAQPLAQRLRGGRVAHAQHQVGRRLGQAQRPRRSGPRRASGRARRSARPRWARPAPPSPSAPPRGQRARPRPRRPARTPSRRAGCAAMRSASAWTSVPSGAREWAGRRVHGRPVLAARPSRRRQAPPRHRRQRLAQAEVQVDRAVRPAAVERPAGQRAVVDRRSRARARGCPTSTNHLTALP